MHSDKTLALECATRLTEIRDVLDAVGAFVQASATHPQVQDDLALVLAEVLSNTARHGYGHEQGKIYLHLSLVEDGVKCIVSDSGTAFDPFTLDERPPPPERLNEGGYGWFLIHALTRDLAYLRKGDKNILQFTVARYLLGNPRAPTVTPENLAFSQS